LIQPLGDCVTVHGAERRDLEDQEIERALEEVGLV
jgi:hypothetical protein